MGRGTDKWAVPDLAEWLRIKHGVPKEKAMDIASTLYPHMLETLIGGRSVLLSGIGTVSARRVEAREKNLFGVRKMMPAAWVLRFTPAKTFHQIMAKRRSAPRDLTNT